MTQEIEAELPEYADGLVTPGYRYRVLYGGRGGARSWSAARQLLVKASLVPLRILCARELQKSIRDSVHQLLVDQIALMKLPGFRVTEHEISHVMGSSFIFLGLRANVEQVKSLEGVDICWVEEAERVPRQSWEVVIPTIRKAGSEIWITFNPDLETDDTYRRFILKKPPRTWRRKVSWKDNPWLPEELEIERKYLQKSDHDSYEHVWEGACRKSSAAQVLHGKWIVDDLEPEATWDGPYYGMDFGFATDPTALVECWIHDHELHIQQELYRVGLELDATGPACLAAIPGCDAYVIRADSARPETISYLSRQGLPRIDGVEKWAGSIEDGVAYLRQFERIVVHSRCRHWIAEAQAYSYKVDERSGDILPTIVDKDNNLIDATRYALAPMIRRRQSAFPALPKTSRKVVPLFARAAR